MDSYLELFIDLKYDSCVRRKNKKKKKEKKKKKKKNFARQLSKLKAISRLAAINCSQPP